MKTLFVILLSIFIAILVAEIFLFISKATIFIACVIAKKDVHVNFKSNIAIIAISSFIITFLLLIL